MTTWVKDKMCLYNAARMGLNTMRTVLLSFNFKDEESKNMVYEFLDGYQRGTEAFITEPCILQDYDVEGLNALRSPAEKLGKHNDRGYMMALLLIKVSVDWMNSETDEKEVGEKDRIEMSDEAWVAYMRNKTEHMYKEWEKMLYLLFASKKVINL